MTDVTFTIDEREVVAREGESVLAAARRHGIDIPHFCQHDKLSIAGSCRMCLVKVNEMPKLQPACNLVPQAKMRVQTKVEQVAESRRNILQFILVNHPVDCGICDKAGECRLQDYQHRYGGNDTRSLEPKREGRKLHALGPRILLDNERCILCSRCVRFTREISKSDALGIVERGRRSFVECTAEKPFDDPYSDNVVGLCPVGALLSKDFLYECRVWFLQPVKSVCTGCSRGCSIQAWRRKPERVQRRVNAGHANEALRVTAVDDPEFNGPWLCNKGFDQHRFMARARLGGPRVDGQPVGLEAAVEAARRILAGAAKPAILVSSHASNEELEALATTLGPRARCYVHEDWTPQPGEAVEDALLIRADKNPNRAGVVARFGDAAFDPAAGHDAVVVWGELTRPLDFAGAPWIHLTPFETPVAGAARVAIPLSNTFERAGTFTNFEGRSNRFEAVFPKPAAAVDAAALFPRLAP